MEMDMQLDELVQAVTAKSSYAAICPDLIYRIGTQELEKRTSFKEAVKSTCRKLHQVGGAFIARAPNMHEWQVELNELPVDLHSPEVKNFCTNKMSAHASTQERLPILEEFYMQSLVEIAPIRSILDLGCGLNPLTLPWMPIDNNISYFGVDIFSDLTAFDSQFLDHFNIKGKVICADILNPISFTPVQLALVLKMLPLIEQIKKNSTLKWLENIPAEYLLISYPKKSLGGKGKGMPVNYTRQFEQVVKAKSWAFKRFEFSSEIAFLVKKQV